MIVFTRRALLLGAAGIGLAGCGGGDGDNDGPPDISYNRENCDRCGMLIAEPKHAAALVPDEGDELHFDDVGEMVAVAQEQGVDRTRVWVHDHDTGDWTDGLAAFYVVDPLRRTPMATGVVAFATREAAEVFGAENSASASSWSELLSSWTMEQG
jgi:copper chaperone NosL